MATSCFLGINRAHTRSSIRKKFHSILLEAMRMSFFFLLSGNFMIPCLKGYIYTQIVYIDLMRQMLMCM